MRTPATCVLAALFVLALPAAAMASPQQAEAAATPSCADCHDQTKVFATNPHGHVWARTPSGALPGAAAATPNAVCETCHGPGQAHMESGGEKDKIQKPAGRQGSDKTCLTCHDLATDQVSRHAGM